MSNASLPKIFILVLNWNGKSDTLACLASLKALTYPNYEVVVIDNGSSDDSSSAIKAAYPDIALLQNQENLGFAEGNNAGIRYAIQRGADALLLLNNDTVVDPGLLDAFAAAMETQPEAGVWGAKAYRYDERTIFDHFGGNWNPSKGHFDLVGLGAKEDGASWEKSFPLDYVCGCALFARKKVFETVGLLEPKFFLFWEEADFCFRARRAGFHVVTCPGAKLWHKVSASFTGGKPHTSYFWWRGRFLWIARNSSSLEKFSLYVRILLPELLKIYKLRLLKAVELRLLSFFRPHQEREKKERKLLQYKAACQGAKDYFLRRFGKGPPWIYRRAKKKEVV